MLARGLDEERDGGDVVHVGGAYKATVVADPEADAVVGNYGDYCPVIDSGLVQPVEQLAEQAVGGLELQQVSLVALLDEEPDRVARTALRPG